MGLTAEGFEALLELHGQDYLLGGVSAKILPGGLDQLDFPVDLKQGENMALSLRAARDAWGGSLPKVGSLLTRASDSKVCRVASTPFDDGVSDTVIFAVAM